MKSGWLSLVLWTVSVFLISSGNGNSILHQADYQYSDTYTLPDGNLVELVYRGDTRTPEQIKNALGFAPRIVEGPLTEEQLYQACSLYHHAYESIPDFTKWVSTSTDPKIANFFANGFAPPGEIPTKRGFLYEIRADEKFVDVRASVGEKNFVYADQWEQAAARPIPWDQVEGWYKLEDFSQQEMKVLVQKEGTLRDMSQFVHHFKKNDQFDFHKYYGRKSAGARYDLAGFRDGNAAWDKEPWKQYKGKSVPDAYEKYVKQVCGVTVRMAGGTPRCPDNILAETGAKEFTMADPLGARDLTGALQSGEPAQYKLDAKFVEASETGKAIEATEEVQAAEVAEMETALADTEAIDAIELGELLEGDLLIDIIIGFLFL